MNRPGMLDLFCGAGGAAMGYHRAGFHVIGVDSEPQPRYPFEFHQDDALDVLAAMAERDPFYPSWISPGWDIAAIHASPPCQAYSKATAASGHRAGHRAMIEPVRAALRRTRLPYVIENVEGARYHLRNPMRLCGSQFGLHMQSHRYFEIVPPLFDMQPPCWHRPGGFSRDHGRRNNTEGAFRDAIGCPWMTCKEARQAIPPVFTEYIGRLLIEAMVPW